MPTLAWKQGKKSAVPELNLPWNSYLPWITYPVY